MESQATVGVNIHVTHHSGYTAITFRRSNEDDQYAEMDSPPLVEDALVRTLEWFRQFYPAETRRAIQIMSTDMDAGQFAGAGEDQP
jgi:hypothetical protein